MSTETIIIVAGIFSIFAGVGIGLGTGVAILLRWLRRRAYTSAALELAIKRHKRAEQAAKDACRQAELFDQRCINRTADNAAKYFGCNDNNDHHRS